MIQNVIQQNKAICADSISSFGESDYTYFTASNGVSTPLDEDAGTFLEIIYMGSLDTIESVRTVYTLLNCLGDIGGLQGIIFPLIGYFIKIYSTNGLDSYIVENLFNPKDGEFKFGVCQSKALNKIKEKGLQRAETQLDIIHFLRYQMLCELEFLKTKPKEERAIMRKTGKFLIDSDFNENTSESDKLDTPK